MQTTVAELVHQRGGIREGGLLHQLTVSQPFSAEQARDCLERYQEAVQRGVSLDERDQTLQAICQAVVDGYHLINIDQVIVQYRDEQEPRLAFAPIMSQRVIFADSGERLEFKAAPGKWSYALKVPYQSTSYDSPSNVRGETAVPMVPIAIRPSDPEGYYILWEPDWTISISDSISVGRADPVLIKQVHGSIYAVIDWWNPTEAEIEAINGALRLY